MKNNIKKIITFLAFAILFTGNSALASVSWNTASNDCSTIAVANWTTQTGYGNPCWSSSTVNASAGDFINVRVYYHNTGTTSATNTRISINAPSGASTSHSFSGQIISDGGNLSFGPATVNISSSQTLTWATTYWYPNQSQSPSSLLNGQTGQEVINGGLNIGTIAPGWSSQGSVVIGFQVSNSTPPASCVINSFTANPTSINQGGSSTLSWSTTGCTNVSISGLGSVNTSGSQTVSPTQTTSYVMLASDSGGRQTSRTTTVTVNQVQNCTINSFTASPTSINQGGSSNLSWNTTGCNSVTIYPNLGSVNASGSQSVSPTQSTMYTLTAYGQNGSQQVDTVTVNVLQQQNCTINSFTANPTSINQGGSSTLSWNTSNCNSVYISGLGTVNSSGSQIVYPTQTTTYKLDAYGAGYWIQQTQSVTVNVNQNQNCYIQNFTANGSQNITIQQGNSVNLNWNTTGCNSVSISNLGSVNTSGSQTVYPSYSTTYTLTAYGQNGTQQTQAVYVNVNNNYSNNCSISYFNASPTSINQGGSSTLSWSTSNCNSITISNLGYSVPFSGNQVIYPSYTTTYTLTAYGQNGGQQSQSVTVNVGNNYNYNNCYISYFNASPTSINQGGSSTLTWSTSGCTSATISNLNYNVSTAGSQVIYPSGTTTYTLTAYGQNYGSNWVQQTQSVTVFVNSTPVVNSCAITTIPTNVAKDSATLNGMFNGSVSNAYFEYGLTSSLGYNTQSRQVSGNNSFSDVITGLSSGTVYYYRLVANCQNGISRGDLKVFQTLEPNVKPVIIQGTTVIGSSSPIMLKIENRSQVIKVGNTIYYTVTYKNIGTKKLTHPVVQVVLPDGISFISSSRGVYSENTKTLNVPIEDLDPNDEGTIFVDAKLDSYKNGENEIVTTALLVYTNTKGAQENAIAYVLNNPEGNSFGLGALALFSGFWGLGIIGWLLLIIIILLIILIYKRYFSKNNHITNTVTTNGNHVNGNGYH